MKLELVWVPIARAALEWYEECVGSGALVKDKSGRLVLNPAVAPLAEALSTVLAGGSVSVTTTRAGDAKRAKRLGDRLAKALAESQRLAASSGMTIMTP